MRGTASWTPEVHNAAVKSGLQPPLQKPNNKNRPRSRQRMASGALGIRMNSTSLLLAVVAILLAASALAPASAVPTGISGVPNGCICHSGSPGADVTVTLEGVPETYEEWGEGATLTVTITGGPNVTNESINQGGFNLVVDGGTLSPVDNTTQIMDGEATHTQYGNDQRTWQVNWTPPSNEIEDVKFTAHGNSVNGDGSPSSDDHWNKVMEISQGMCSLHPCEMPEDEKTPAVGLVGILVAVGVAGLLGANHRTAGKRSEAESQRDSQR